MNREELIEKMCNAYVTEICGRVTEEGWKDSWRSASCRLFRSRRSHYLKPKSDPAVEAIAGMTVIDSRDFSVRISHDQAKQIVAAVRAADKEASNA